MKFFLLYEDKTARAWGGGLLAQALGECLIDLGHEVKVSCRIVDDDSDRKCCLVLISERPALLVDRWDGLVCMYNVTEAYPSARRWRGSFRKASVNWPGARLDCVWDYSPNNREAFDTLGIDSVYMPIGYHDVFDLGAKSIDVDVGFLGAIHFDSRRLYTIESLKDDFSVEAYTYQKSIGFARLPQILRVLGCRTFIHIHAHRSRCNFPSTRIIQLGACNRMAMVCEDSNWYPSGLKREEHLLIYPKGDFEVLRSQIRHLLVNRRERLDMANRCHDFVKNQWRFIDHVERGIRSWNP